MSVKQDLDEIVSTLWFRLEDWEREYKAQQEISASLAHPECNRYRDIVPYDRWRVLVKTRPHDYINASYIDQLGVPRSIAAQAPHNENVFANFWAMVHEQGVRVIVMVANTVEDGRVKVHRYWPDHAGGRTCYGSTSVQPTTEHKSSCYVERHFVYSYNGQASTVVQFQFTEWPDKGVPSSPQQLIDFAKKVRTELQQSEKGTSSAPLLVHCSAGIGRTGTFLALLAAMEQLDRGEMPDLEQLVMMLRKRRYRMVQVQAQLKFLALCVAAYSQTVLSKGKQIVDKTSQKLTTAVLNKPQSLRTRTIRKPPVQNVSSTGGSSEVVRRDRGAAMLLAHPRHSATGGPGGSGSATQHPVSAQAAAAQTQQPGPATSFDLLGDFSSTPAQPFSVASKPVDSSTSTASSVDLFGSDPFQVTAVQHPRVQASSTTGKEVDLFGLTPFANSSTVSPVHQPLQPMNTAGISNPPTAAVSDSAGTPMNPHMSANPFASAANFACFGATSTTSAGIWPSSSTIPIAHKSTNPFDDGSAGTSATSGSGLGNPSPVLSQSLQSSSSHSPALPWSGRPRANASTDWAVIDAAFKGSTAFSHDTGTNVTSLHQSGLNMGDGSIQARNLTGTGWPNVGMGMQHNNSADFGFSSSGNVPGYGSLWQSSTMPASGSQGAFPTVPQQSVTMAAYGRTNAPASGTSPVFAAQGIRTNSMPAAGMSTAAEYAPFPSVALPHAGQSVFGTNSSQPLASQPTPNAGPQMQMTNYAAMQQQQSGGAFGLPAYSTNTAFSTARYPQWSHPGSAAQAGMASAQMVGVPMNAVQQGAGGWPSQMQPMTSQSQKPQMVTGTSTPDLLGDFSLAAMTSSLKLV